MHDDKRPGRVLRKLGGFFGRRKWRERHAALCGLNDHYLRDIGYRRERPTGSWRHDPWM